MSEKTGKNLRVLFVDRPRLGPFRLFPLTAGRVAILEDKGNSLAVGSKSGEVSSFELFEAMMVCLLDRDELAEKAVLEEVPWKIEVRRFQLGEMGDYASEFGGGGAR
jgi:hypothetical protein